jgi:hypothetical protein
MDPVTHAVLGRSIDYIRQRGPTEKGRGLAVVRGAFTFATVTSDASTGVLRVLWSDLRYCDTPTSCAIRAGGDLSPSGDVRLVVLVGNWLQTR